MGDRQRRDLHHQQSGSGDLPRAGQCVRDLQRRVAGRNLVRPDVFTPGTPGVTASCGVARTRVLRGDRHASMPS
ncbi:hypothetical protein LUTEI9C_70120 [Luteimonas sp. 9C]|nr:hypothetical protein LUTEI9C_70120 [Luteimonas sp. 9C]